VAQCVGRDLRASNNALGTVGHKRISSTLAAITNEVSDNQLSISVKSRPRPNISPEICFPLRADVLSLRADEGPNLIALQVTNAQSANVAIMIGSASASRIFQ
jgi:hypothetical protein